MKMLYQNLVSNHMMPPDEFWKLYYKVSFVFLQNVAVNDFFSPMKVFLNNPVFRMALCLKLRVTCVQLELR